MGYLRFRKRLNHDFRFFLNAVKDRSERKAHTNYWKSS